MITRKRLTKLINPEFRRSILVSMTPAKKEKYKIPQYAAYVTDLCIVHRNKEHENDKEWNYGYTPIQCLGACMKDGTISKRFFEFNSVNHFLKDKDGDSAREVVEAILIEWTKEDRNVVDFDMDRIDAEFAKIEAEYVEAEKEKAAENEAGRKLKEMIEPILDKTQGLEYEKAVELVSNEIRPVLDTAVKDKIVNSYVLGYGRNTPDTKSRGEFNLDVGYRMTEKSDYVVLTCSVRAKKELTENGQQ